MTSIPSNLARVPNALSSQIMLGSLTATNQRLLNAQIQLTTGKLINRPSDNAISSSTISVLDDILERRDQRVRNLTHAESVLNTSDAALAEATDLLQEARSIGLSQIGVGSDETTRANQARVIDSMLTEMSRIGNRQFQDMYLFGGNATSNPPFVELMGSTRYQGQGVGLFTDTGLARPVPITTAGSEAFGALSARVEGNRDLNPLMVADTRLADLNGARGFGVSLGSINVDVGGTDLTVDLSTAHSVGDMANLIQTAIQTVDAGATVSIDAGTGNRFAIAGNAVAITVSDIAAPGTAADLGLTGTYAISGGTGSDVDPVLTQNTQLSSLNGITVPLGTIRLSNAGQTRDLDLSAATNVQDIMNLVHGLKIGIRVEIANTGDRLNFINELSGSPSGGMSIAEVTGGATATELGVRSFDTTTLLSDFNNGLGVQFKTGSVNPITGLPDPSLDVDFRIALKDGRTFDVDLAGVTTVQDVLDQINAAATGAGIGVPAEFTAALTTDGNGIALTDNTPGGVGTTTSVVARNGSFAAQDLGILGSTTGAILTGQDRATVAVESTFAHLAALRDALLANDERGITLATGKLETDINRVTSARADVGVRTRRITDAQTREEDLKVQDSGLKSQVQDLDFTEAAIRFTQLQQQLQAGLATAARTSALSLLDFLS
jgi:flagellin-like hook-associated protein FlgL